MAGFNALDKNKKGELFAFAGCHVCQIHHRKILP